MKQINSKNDKQKQDLSKKKGFFSFGNDLLETLHYVKLVTTLMKATIK